MIKTVVQYFILFLLSAGYTVYGSEQRGPVEVYDLYLTAIKTADSLNDLSPYISERKMSALKSIPEEDQPGSLQFKKNIANSTRRIDVKSDVNDNEAKITINAVDTSSKKNVVVTVYMLLEGGEWKVDKEEFDFTIANN